MTYVTAKDGENHIQNNVRNVSPPSLSNKGTKYVCSLARMLMNFWKSPTLLRVRNSSSLSLRSRLCLVSIMCCLCSHVMHPTLPSSVINASLGSIRSSSWTPLTVSVRIRASSKGRTSPNSAPISTDKRHNQLCNLLSIHAAPCMVVNSGDWALDG